MNGLPYYKAYPRDFVEGTIGMDFELKGAYRLVLDLIYMQGGQLPDDARYISGLLGCTLKKWNGLRQRLIDLGKIEVRGEFLANNRADKELETLGKLSEKQRENRSRSNKNKELQSPRFDQSEPDTEPYKDDDDSAGAREDFFSDFLTRLVSVAGDTFTDQSSRAIAEKWLRLPGLDADAIIQSVEDTLAAAPHGQPISSLNYFTPELRKLSALRTQPDPAPSRPSQAKRPVRDHDALMRRALAQLNEDGSIRL